ncbi:MAG: PKD domain containing protein, partial [Actinomycetota bacterium]
MALVAGLVPLAPAGAVNVPHAVIVSDDPSDDTPHVLDGKVEAIAQVGSTIVAGGKFNEVRNAGASTRFPRTNLFAFDAATGKVSQTFAPQLDGTVETLAASSDGTSVYVGGTFKNVDGQAQKKIARLDVATGARVGNFKPNPNAAVKDIVVRGSTVYLAGDFKKVKSVLRGGLAAVDATTGALSADLNIPFTEPRLGSSPSVNKIDVTPDASTLIAIGNFKRAGGQVREQIAMVDLSSTPDSLANWQTNRFPASDCSSSFDTYMRDVDISLDGSYFAVATTGAYDGGPPVLCDTVSRWETGARGSNLQPTWVDYTGGDTLYSVAITGTAIYVGGHQRWMNNPFAGDSKGPGAVDRPGIAAIDPNNGVPFSWNPGRSRGVGAFALVSTDQGLYVGSDTDKLGGEFHARV